MNIATWNVNSLNVRLPHVIDWLATQSIDVLALQELKLDQDKFPEDVLLDAGYQSAWYGQKTYNGVAFISKESAQDVIHGMPDFKDPQRRVISASFGDTRVINAYCVNGETVGSEKFAYKKTWFEALTSFITSQLQTYPKLILLGDFNIAPADLDVYDPKAWEGKILCSEDERMWFKRLLDLGLTDSLRAHNPDEPCFTWWDYRMNRFTRKQGMRIDHILISDALKPHLKTVTVDTIPRSWERPSDHTPVIASLTT